MGICLAAYRAEDLVATRAQGGVISSYFIVNIDGDKGFWGLTKAV